MDFRLTDEQRQVEEMVRALARKEFAPRAAQGDEESRYPEENHRRLAELGLLGMLYPASFGGSEAGPVAYTIALREVAGGGAPPGGGGAGTKKGGGGEYPVRGGGGARGRSPSPSRGPAPAQGGYRRSPGKTEGISSSTARRSSSRTARTPASRSSWRCRKSRRGRPGPPSWSPEGRDSRRG